MSKTATQAMIFAFVGVVAAEVAMSKTPLGALLK